MDLTLLIPVIGYFALIVIVGIISGKGASASADDYFLANRKLPFYAVGASMIGSNISTEHFIGMIGAAYVFGIAPAGWEWISSFLSLSVLLFFFLPYYYRNKLYTIPSFLEAHYGPSTRTIFAAITCLHLVVVLLAGALYAGGLILQELLFPQDVAQTADGHLTGSLIFGVALISISTGAYSIYGGLRSVVWTDFVQVIILLIGGASVSYFSIRNAGGFGEMMNLNEAADSIRVNLFRPSDDEFAPWTGILTLWLSLGVWYSCTNQFYIQRCLGARSEWDARMGVITAMGLKMLMPLLVVIPGMAAFVIFGQGLDRDQIYIILVQEVLPTTLVGIVLAAMAAAIMSTVSSVLNSVSTILSIDFLQRFFRPDASQDILVRFGRWSTFSILILVTLLAPLLVKFEGGLFIYIQEMAAYFGPPIAAVFLHAIFNPRATERAANITLIGGILVSIALRVYGSFDSLPLAGWISPFLNRAFLAWLICMLALCLISLADRRAPVANRVLWNAHDLNIPAHERHERGFGRNIFLWWGLIAALVLTLGIYFN